MDFEFQKQELDGVYLISSEKKIDERGYLCELFRKDVFLKNGIDVDFVQENFSYSEYKTLRGLHYQKNPHAQDKLIYVNYGSILDVVVDLRKDSKTFGKYLKFELDSEKPCFLYVPKGFAHGFLTLSDFACVTYKLSSYYQPDFEDGIVWNDEVLNIDWEVDFEPILSDKDKNLPKFDVNVKL